MKPNRRNDEDDFGDCACPECADRARGFSADEAAQRALDTMERMMDKFGVSIQHVFSQPGEPSFSYTIGLFLHGLPEFIVFGPPARVTQPILNHLAIATRDHGTLIQAGDRVEHLIAGLPAAVISVADPSEHLCTVFAMRERRANPRLPIRALQIVLPDPKGRMPWHRAYHGMAQPLLSSDVAGDRPPVVMPDLR